MAYQCARRWEAAGGTMTPDEIIDKLEKRGPRPLSAWPEVQSPAAH